VADGLRHPPLYLIPKVPPATDGSVGDGRHDGASSADPPSVPSDFRGIRGDGRIFKLIHGGDAVVQNALGILRIVNALATVAFNREEVPGDSMHDQL